jgi:hypothetical protein
VNAAADRDRHEECCDLLERAVVRRAEADPTLFRSTAVDSDYITLLAELALRRRNGDTRWDAGRLGASVVPPADVERHLTAFVKFAADRGAADRPDVVTRTAFLRDHVLPTKCGLVEAVVCAPAAVDRSLRGPAAPRRVRVASAQAGRQDVAELFRRAVAAALEDDRPVNMNMQNHVVITTVLAEFLVAQPGEEEAALRIAYGDGSEARPFPLRCLTHTPDDDGDTLVFPAGLMSMRHLLLDGRVVVNWYRNREIDQSDTLAHSDEVCYRQAVRQLETLRTTADRRVVVRLYHTGFEPAVVAFYRAAVESVREHGDWLRVVPHYHADDGFRDGPSWPPVS